MKSFAAFWMRLLALAALALMFGTLFMLGQSSSIKVVNLIPASLSGETNQDSEPFLAVQTANPQVMAPSAFAPNPVSSTGTDPVYVSQDRGSRWVLTRFTAL